MDLKKSFDTAWIIMKADEADIGICDGCLETALIGRLPIGGGGNSLLCYDCWRKEMQWRHLRNTDMEESGYMHPNDYYDIEPWPHSDMEPGMERYQ